MEQWNQQIADLRVDLENAALAIRSKKLRSLAAKILEVAEPQPSEWGEDLAMFLAGQIKLELGPKVMDARKDQHSLNDESDGC